MAETRSVHMGLSVRGALTNWKLRDFRGMFKAEDGRTMTPQEAKATLLDELSQGHEVIPYGKCDNWDWKKGCQGHSESPKEG